MLYRENLSEEKYVNFLIDVSSDRNLEENFRREFQTKLIFAYYEKNNCEKLILELIDKPGYLLKLKKSNSEQWQHIMFLKGSCLINKKKWAEAHFVKFNNVRAI